MTSLFPGGFFYNREPTPPLKNYSFDRLPIQNALKRGDYPAIIKDQELFWLLFCRSLVTFKARSTSFSFSIEADRFKVYTREHLLEYLKSGCSQLHSFFVKMLADQRDLTLLAVKILYTGVFLREKSDCITINTSYLSDNHIDEYIFDGYIRPALAQIAKSIQVSCLFEDTRQSVILDGTERDMKVEAIHIKWNSKIVCVSHIMPLEIPKRPSIQKQMYSMYQKGLLCDLTLEAKDGDLQVHANMMYVSGGEVIQAMLVSPMQESLEKTLSFENFSYKTLEAFIDYIYLGVDGILAESIDERGVDPYELFELAHFCQIEPLINHCTNLLCIFTGPKDVEKIHSYAEKCDNSHLRKLHLQLTSIVGEEAAPQLAMGDEEKAP